MKERIKKMFKEVVICLRASFITLTSAIWLMVGILIVNRQYGVDVSQIIYIMLAGLCGIYFYEVYKGHKELGVIDDGQI